MTGDSLPGFIRDLKLPVIRKERRLRSVELTPHARSLRKLLGEIWEEHDLAVMDWSLRGDPDKPRREWHKNKRNAAPRYDYSAYLPPDPEVRFLREWDAHYLSTYALPTGNPSFSHDKRLPLAPLDAIYLLLRRWWQAQELNWAWDPDYRADEDHSTPRLEYMNPSLRLFYLVARSCGPDYSVANCLSVHDRLRSPTRATNKAAMARASRKKAAKPPTRKKTR